mmetsp:Transcript_1246/g.3738  ORF Transcript_1246/g.3738 Transcript_1246/m.3738 type:complete len:337 (+) Transcript_1246:718-1728(+)
MHSFDNGIALRIKKDNWGQLLKFFRKAGIHDIITQTEVNQIIHCEDGAVIKFVNRMYETLTQRTVQKVSQRPLPGKSPAFARETGAAAIRKSLRGAALAETSDETTRANQLAEHVNLHEQSLQGERSFDPNRFHVASIPHGFKGSGTQGALSRAQARIVDADVSLAPQVTVKAIQVRQVDRSVAQLRGAREIAADATALHETLSHMAALDIPRALPDALTVRQPTVADTDIATLDGALEADLKRALLGESTAEAAAACATLADKVAARSAASAAAVRTNADKYAAKLTPTQMKRLGEAWRDYDAAGEHAETAAHELHALKTRLSLAEAAYRSFKTC